MGICVQTNARKSGELFRNMFYLKQVELDENSFILGLQAGVPEEYDIDISMNELEAWCQSAFFRLEENMVAIEQVLAERFWYAAAKLSAGSGTGMHDAGFSYPPALALCQQRKM